MAVAARVWGNYKFNAFSIIAGACACPAGQAQLEGLVGIAINA